MKYLITFCSFLMPIFLLSQITIEELDGVRETSVVVDEDGKLKRSSFKYLSIPASAFHPNEIDHTESWKSTISGAFFITPSSNSLVAPVMLPHGSTVTSVTIDYVDNDGTNDAELKLWSYNGLAINTEMSASTSGMSPDVQPVVVNSVFTIDNQSKSYTFKMAPVAPLSMNVNFQIIRVLIQYVD